MKFLIQRVSKAGITIDSGLFSSIGKGLLILVGITDLDSQREIDFLVDKAVNLRIFEDENGKMNLSVKDVGGQIMVVSQFTLYGDCRKGRRPGFDLAASPDISEPIYNRILDAFKHRMPGRIEQGQFGAHMDISLVNDGPVTFMLEK